MSTLEASRVRLSKDHIGIVHNEQIPHASFASAERLLQHNHDNNHIFWRDVNGHNHMVHDYLTLLALGASPEQLQQAFDDNQPIQRPPPAINEEAVAGLSNEKTFLAAMNKGSNYTNFLVFFERQIEVKGWKAVVQEYVFARTPVAEAVLSELYEGAYHPIIHFGLGIEFAQPSIIAEGLAQAAAHTNVGIDKFLFDAEKAAAAKGPSKSIQLIDLLTATHSSPTIHHAARWTDFANKINHGVFGRAGPEMTALAASFHVDPATLQSQCAQVLNISAYMAGAAQRFGKGRKIDFFYMHNVTSSLFLSVLLAQDFIAVEDKVRLVEWKGRLDLAWYAASGCPALDVEAVAAYEATHSAGLDWNQLYAKITAMHDDGHVAKFVRALRNASEVSREFERGADAEAFPLKGDMWLNLARMAYDTTEGLPDEKKWIWGAGFDQPWGGVSNASVDP